MNILRDEKGFVLVFAIVMPMLLLFCGLMIDLGRIQIAKGKLQTAADAASLAAVTTASHEPIINVEEDESGGTNISFEGWDVSLKDPVLAYIEAEKYLGKNTSAEYWVKKGMDFSDMNGEITGTDSYYVEAEVRVKTLFYGQMKALLTGDMGSYDVPVRVISNSQFVAVGGN